LEEKMQLKKQQTVYAFIDSQNLNLGTQSAGWKLDYSKFRNYLRTKYFVTKAFIFIGYIEKNVKLYQFLKNARYILIFKPVLQIKKEQKVTYKGNVDAELVLHTMIEFSQYDSAITVSGDGDFRCLVEYLANQQKLFKIITPNTYYSSFLREFGQFITSLTLIKGKLMSVKQK
jgi:uncharacterized LabA/DUF88 family protein